jgi:hypothetical protein
MLVDVSSRRRLVLAELLLVGLHYSRGLRNFPKNGGISLAGVIIFVQRRHYFLVHAIISTGGHYTAATFFRDWLRSSGSQHTRTYFAYHGDRICLGSTRWWRGSSDDVFITAEGQ